MRTGKRYSSQVGRIVKFFREKYTDPIQATTEMTIEFLTEYFKTGVGFFHRLAILLCLTIGQRDQLIKWLNLNYIKISSDKKVIFVSETLKTTRRGYHLPPIKLKIFQDQYLCVAGHLKQYIKITAPLEILVQTNYY